MSAGQSTMKTGRVGVYSALLKNVGGCSTLICVEHKIRRCIFFLELNNTYIVDVFELSIIIFTTRNYLSIIDEKQRWIH
jgi:hypothetical protein